MTDVTDSSRLPDAYSDYRTSATDEAAYAAMLSRLGPATGQAPGAPPAAPGAEAGAGEGRLIPTRLPEPPAPAAGAAKGAAPSEDMIAAEVQRLSSEKFDKSKYANPTEAEAAMRRQALANLGVPADQAAAKTPEQEAAELNEAIRGGPDSMRAYVAARSTAAAVAARAGSDIAGGLLDLPVRSLWGGIHAAVRSTLNQLTESADALNLTKWGMGAIDWTVAHESDKSLTEGWHLLSGEERESFEKEGKLTPLGEHIPLQPGDPRTVTGSLVKGVVQFGTSMAIAGREFEALGLPTQLAGWAGRGITAARGFLAMFEGFDGAQHRLSDLVQQVPSLRNPVTDFLSTKPDDNAAVGRLKNALEGTVLAQAADGVLAGLKVLRGAVTAKETAEAFVEHAEALPPPHASDGLRALGEAANEAQMGGKKPSLLEIGDQWGLPRPAGSQTQKLTEAASRIAGAGVLPEDIHAAAKGDLQGLRPESDLKINFARIDSGEDVQRVMGELADHFKGDIDAARRGVRTFQQTELGAQAEDAFKVLMERRQGEPLNAEQGLAARQLWASSAAKTMELADIAVRAPTVENLFAFRRMLTTHAAIQQEVIAARTETARALGAWRIPAGDDSLRLEQMMSSLSGDAGLKGGAQTALTLAQKVQELAVAQDYKTLSTFLEKSVYARTRDAVLEGYTNALLTAPLTHIKVIASNTATIALRIAERAVAARIDDTMGVTDGVAMGEAAAQTAGLVGGVKDALRYAGKIARAAWAEDPWEGGRGFEMPPLEEDPLSNSIRAARTGQYSLKPFGGSEYMQSAGAISQEALRMGDAGFVGQGVDYLGQLVRIPGRALTAEHDFFRSVGYRMELQSLATRQAVADVRAGTVSEEGLGARVQELVDNPPPQLHMDAVNGTLYQTFTDAPGKLATRIGELRNDYPLVRVIIPFYKIPSRILAFTGERTPLAPFMQTFRDNIAAGGARQSTALAQVGLGTLTMLGVADYVLSGRLTGSGPAEKGTRSILENEGWQPYSVKVGNRWVQYNRIEPVGSSMAMAADAVEAMQNFHAGVNGDDPDTANLAMATVFSVANDITSKSYLQGLSNFFEAMSGDPSKLGQALKGEVGSLVPAGLAALDRVTDPNKRAVYSLVDAIRARTPGASEKLPPLRGPWGEPVPQGSGLGANFDLFSPMGTRPAANEPIDAELLRQQIDIPRTPSRTALHGITLDLNRIDPKIYSRFQELAGNAYKGPDGLGLKDALNALVTGQHPLSPTYQRLTDGPDGTKADMVRDIVSEYRNGAKEQLLAEYPQLGGMVKQGQDAKQFLKAGTQQ